MCKSCIGIVGGTGTPPYGIQAFGALSNTLPYTTISFCKPTSGVSFHQNSEPPRSECGIYTRDLDVYPLNQYTTLDSSGYYTFGASEMALVFARIDNYPRIGSFVDIEFRRPDGSVIYLSSHSLPVPNPSWTWWYAFVWGVIGKFDDTFIPSDGDVKNEIIAPGTYTAIVRTPWGNSTIDYAVTSTAPCQPPGGVDHMCASHTDMSMWNVSTCSYDTQRCSTGVCDSGTGSCAVAMPLEFDVTGLGSVFVYKNGSLIGTALPGIPVTATYVIGDTIAFQAYPDHGWMLESMCDYPQTECRTDLIYSYTVTGQLPQRMIATFKEAPCVPMWVCHYPLDGTEGDGCGNVRNNPACNPIEPPPPACGVIPVDSWKPEITNPTSGATVPIVIRSKDPNKHFLVQSNVLGGINTLMFDGTTDATGCYSGELPPLPDGTYNIFVCYDIAGVCLFSSTIGTKSITWGTSPPFGINDLIKYAPYLIGAWAVATIAGAMRR